MWGIDLWSYGGYSVQPTVQDLRLSGGGFPHAWKEQSSILLKSSANWMKLIHILKDSLFFSKSTGFNINLIQIHPEEYLTQKLTYKINHYCTIVKLSNV